MLPADALAMKGCRRRLRPAGVEVERLLGLEQEQIAGRTREELGLDVMLDVQSRLAVRHGRFREKGREHELLVVSDAAFDILRPGR